MRAIFVDANESLAEVTERLVRPGDPPVAINRNAEITPAELPKLLAGHAIAIDDHTQFPVDIVRQCPDLKHIVFLGTGARSYMDPEALKAECGVEVHIIKGYGDTAVAEMAFALLWDAARQTAMMDAAIRRGEWPRVVGMQLTGKTIGLIGTGGIGAEMARLCAGIGMKVIAWNRSPKAIPGVEFVSLERLLAESDVVSLHLLLNDETRGFLSAARLAQMKRGAILVNTARGAIVDEAAMIAALQSRQLGWAALDVFVQEPMPAGHPLTKLPNVTLTSHAAFRTPEASDNLIGAALGHCRRIVKEGM
ncbi:NAD(P)-binding domain-containing protein [Siccirubricoccus sp. KC 17139]|uniref:NAD(P)-binding domain-containing protein n=1 Tax=Siccirubricoccus soli TaxID=2899147 RepID=A0ABT1D9A9_9PROT|nr:NAD(P)-dependent oxidoreductase [Siccirubricoccus soli]MCO6418444.1 NAD(P)-binding domain-containing protein [Siccirubricoccus soli]MCP2684579.1 NAD(P)-binding domain-containing protein [Siccirubricoccus soli]